MADATAFLARRRVTLGFMLAAAAVLLAQPTWRSWTAGVVVALIGEFLRVWAAGHLEKSREVTRSGPYRWTRHPLYVGSGVIAVGAVIASRSAVLGVLVAIYLFATLAAAIRTEEAYLRQAFGDSYDRYARSVAPGMDRGFSIARAIRNREHRAVFGLIGGFGLLALKILLNL
jgi:protein-S-isoprenylcysteine O-methyltransferase Ste14